MLPLGTHKVDWCKLARNVKAVFLTTTEFQIEPSSPPCWRNFLHVSRYSYTCWGFTQAEDKAKEARWHQVSKVCYRGCRELFCPPMRAPADRCSAAVRACFFGWVDGVSALSVAATVILQKFVLKILPFMKIRTMELDLFLSCSHTTSSLMKNKNVSGSYHAKIDFHHKEIIPQFSPQGLGHYS